MNWVYWVYWAKPLPSNLPVLNPRVGRPTELQVPALVRYQENRRQMIRHTTVILTWTKSFKKWLEVI